MNSLKLNRLSDQKLAEKQMNMVLGGAGESKCPGGGCCCGCVGSSSLDDNMKANWAADKYTESVCKPNPTSA